MISPEHPCAQITLVVQLAEKGDLKKYLWTLRPKLDNSCLKLYESWLHNAIVYIQPW